MIRSFFYCIVLTTVAALVSSDSAVDEPMVAFVCNRPAMHSSNRGWVRDETTSCIKDPIDILNYCRKIYPERDVWNVVESTEMVTIRNWCNFGHIKCRHRYTVRPYRCLVGAFQSEALQVPEHCVFNHIHGPEASGGADCQSSADWNRTARQACIDRHSGFQLHGFAVLQPCGIDGFGGVEFVCCPTPVTATAPLNTAVQYGGGRHHSRRTTVSKPEMTTARPTTTTATPTTATTTTTTVATTTVEQTTALRDDVDDIDDDDDDDDDEEEKKPAAAADSTLATGVMSEHDRFMKVKTELEKRHHEKVAKMMRDWVTARRRVQEIKNIDIKGGEKFNREMTARFQKAYEALERDTAAERKRLLAEHQVKVEEALTRKKTHAMESYVTAITTPHADATRVLNALLQYVKAEQKDRVHTINHYEHVEESDPVEAEAQRTAVAERLRGIDERVTKAIDMLSRLPKYEKKIRQQIEKFLSSYQSLDESLAVIMAKINEKSNGNRAVTPKSSKQLHSMTASVTAAPDDPLTTVVATAHDDTTPVAATSMENRKQTTVVESASATTNEPAKTEMLTTSKQAVTSQELRHVIEMKPVVEHVAHNQKSDLTVLENFVMKLPVRADSTGHLAAPLAIVACGIAVFVIILVGVAFVRRRSVNGGGLSLDTANGRGVTEIDRSVRPGAASADSRVPINGYENPTYQYYAQAEAAAAVHENES